MVDTHEPSSRLLPIYRQARILELAPTTELSTHCHIVERRETGLFTTRIYYPIRHRLPRLGRVMNALREDARIHYQFIHPLPRGARGNRSSHLLPNSTPTSTVGVAGDRDRAALAPTTTLSTHCHELAPGLVERIDPHSHLLPILRSTSTSRHTTRDARANARIYYQNFNPLPRGFPRGPASLVSYANSHLLPLFALTATSQHDAVRPARRPRIYYHFLHSLPRLATLPRCSTRSTRIYYPFFDQLPYRTSTIGFNFDSPRTYYQTFNSLPLAEAFARPPPA